MSPLRSTVHCVQSVQASQISELSAHHLQDPLPNLVVRSLSLAEVILGVWTIWQGNASVCMAGKGDSMSPVWAA